MFKTDQGFGFIPTKEPLTVLAFRRYPVAPVLARTVHSQMDKLVVGGAYRIFLVEVAWDEASTIILALLVEMDTPPNVANPFAACEIDGFI